MSASANCELIGRWRIVKADLWDRDYLDLVEPAYLEIKDDGQGDLVFGALTAAAELSYGRTIVYFRWNGSDEGDQISGSGSADLQDDGTIEIELSFDKGDDATLIARRQ